jgi:hypothetical protein
MSPSLLVVLALMLLAGLRVSPPVTLFDSQNRYAKSADFDEALSGSATVTYSADESSVLLNVTSASGDKVIRETKTGVCISAREVLAGDEHLCHADSTCQSALSCWLLWRQQWCVL